MGRTSSGDTVNDFRDYDTLRVNEAVAKDDAASGQKATRSEDFSKGQTQQSDVQVKGNQSLKRSDFRSISPMLKFNAIVVSKDRHLIVWGILIVVLDATALVGSLLLAVLLASRFSLIR